MTGIISLPQTFSEAAATASALFPNECCLILDTTGRPVDIHIAAMNILQMAGFGVPMRLNTPEPHTLVIIDTQHTLADAYRRLQNADAACKLIIP